MWSSRSILSLHFPSDSFWLLFFLLWRSLCVTAILHTKSKRNQKTWRYIQSPSCSLIYSNANYIVSHIYIHIYTHTYISVLVSLLLRIYRPARLCVVLFALLLARSIFSGWLSDIAWLILLPRAG
uniref:HL01958p n=1 Tax=Drosophila melanogaster TaxID=7227 RepID=Q95S13_DROME|nr:HL01958p [Drosophila melanogaster]